MNVSKYNVFGYQILRISTYLHKYLGTYSSTSLNTTLYFVDYMSRPYIILIDL